MVLAFVLAQAIKNLFKDLKLTSWPDITQIQAIKPGL
jgi:hypothetical protein